MFFLLEECSEIVSQQRGDEREQWTELGKRKNHPAKSTNIVECFFASNIHLFVISSYRRSHHFSIVLFFTFDFISWDLNYHKTELCAEINYSRNRIKCYGFFTTRRSKARTRGTTEMTPRVDLLTSHWIVLLSLGFATLFTDLFFFDTLNWHFLSHFQNFEFASRTVN